MSAPLEELEEAGTVEPKRESWSESGSLPSCRFSCQSCHSRWAAHSESASACRTGKLNSAAPNSILDLSPASGMKHKASEHHLCLGTLGTCWMTPGVATAHSYSAALSNNIRTPHHLGTSSPCAASRCC